MIVMGTCTDIIMLDTVWMAMVLALDTDDLLIDCSDAKTDDADAPFIAIWYSILTCFSTCRAFVSIMFFLATPSWSAGTVFVGGRNPFLSAVTCKINLKCAWISHDSHRDFFGFGSLSWAIPEVHE